VNRSRVPFAAVVAGCLAIVALWVSGQSFWIDECNAAVKAIQPDFRSFWTKFSGMGGSDFQMPFYMFLLWCWEKIADRGEFALRALNILFAWSAILLVAFRTALPRRFRLLWCLAAAVSPMLAVYMDEARPYALQFLAATALYLPFLSGPEKDCVDGFDFRTFSIGLILLCGSSLTGVVFAFWPCLWLFILLARNRTILRFVAGHAIWIAVDAVLFSLFAGFYLHTLASGARASAVSGTSIFSTIFCAYEFLGFMGAGPSRLALRSAQASALRVHLLPLASMSAAYGFFLLAAIVSRPRITDCDRTEHSIRPGIPVLLSLVGVLSMLLVGVTMEMRVLARHLMPALPAFLFLFSGVAARLLVSALWRRVAVAVLFLAWISSAGAFRFSPRHAKDDYRRACGIARSALSEGKVVWWAADEAALTVYGLDNTNGTCFVRLMNPSGPHLDEVPSADCVILSKPDVYDGKGAIRNWLSANRFEVAEVFPAFQIQTRQLRP
jgi:hypothetical protein